MIPNKIYAANKAPISSKLMQIPLHKVKDVLTILLNENQRKTILHSYTHPYKADVQTKYSCPLYSSKVAAGFPSPATDHQEERLDLNRYLVPQPASTFFVKATGDSMINVRIHEGDLLIVDQSVPPQSGKIVIAAVNGELTVKRMSKVGQKLFLMPENSNFSLIEITEDTTFEILGIVTSVIHPV